VKVRLFHESAADSAREKGKGLPDEKLDGKDTFKWGEKSKKGGIGTKISSATARSLLRWRCKRFSRYQRRRAVAEGKLSLEVAGAAFQKEGVKKERDCSSVGGRRGWRGLLQAAGSSRREPRDDAVSPAFSRELARG